METKLQWSAELSLRPCFAGALLALFLGTILTTGAEVIHDNGPPNKNDGSEMTHWLQADDFTLTIPTRLEGVKFWNFERPAGFAGSIFWQIHANSANNSPGNPLTSGTSMNMTHSATGFVVFGAFAEYVNTFAISPRVVLPPGTYWLALHNGPLSNNVAANLFYWESTNNVSARPGHENPAPFVGPWVPHDFPGLPSEFAFQLNGVPGPRITAITLASGVPSISFTTRTAQNYRVEYKNDLSDSSWTPLLGAASVPGTGSVVTVTDPDPNVGNLPRRFYRALLL